MKPLTERRRRSARECFANCKARYKAEYLDGVDMGSSASRRGSTFHRAKQIYISALWATRQTDDLQMATDAISVALREQPLPFAEELDCRDLWVRFVERFTLPLATFYAVETALQMFSTMLQFDLVVVPQADTLLIEDSKTHWQIPSDGSLRDSFQFRFYVTAARLLFPGFEHYRLAFIFERFNERIELELTPAEMDAFEDVIADSDAAMEAAEVAGEFPATGGAWCSTCQAACPLMAHGGRMPLERLRTPQEASEAISALAALHRRQAVLRQAVQGYVDASGGQSVEAHGISWAYRPVERKRYPAGAALDVLAGGQVDTSKLSFSGSSLKRYVTSKGKYRHVEAALKAIAVTSTSTEFGPRVASLEDDGPAPEDGE